MKAFQTGNQYPINYIAHLCSRFYHNSLNYLVVVFSRLYNFEMKN